MEGPKVLKITESPHKYVSIDTKDHPWDMIVGKQWQGLYKKLGHDSIKIN